jgi:hypothetical protein
MKLLLTFTGFNFKLVPAESFSVVESINSTDHRSCRFRSHQKKPIQLCEFNDDFPMSNSTSKQIKEQIKFGSFSFESGSFKFLQMIGFKLEVVKDISR